MSAINQYRRRFLRTVGVVGATGLAGCSLRGGSGRSPVRILTAGSLQYAFERWLKPATDVPIEIEAHGSATVMRLVADGLRDPDIVTVADTALFDRQTAPSWYVPFTSNAVVLAYTTATAAGRRFGRADPQQWYRALHESDSRIGRTDPDTDPLGYRTLFTLELADRYYDVRSGRFASLTDAATVVPETALMSQLETGALDVVFTYRNMAVERGFEWMELPAAIDLSDPAFDESWYSTVSYELPSGQVVRGGPIQYGTTMRHRTESVRSVFLEQITGEYLTTAGFVSPAGYPRAVGPVPDPVREKL